MFSFSKLFSLSNDFEIELLVVGNMVTEDLYLGLMKNDDENIIDATKAVSVTIKIGFLFFQRKINMFVD
jgi:hypothetical protein